MAVIVHCFDGNSALFLRKSRCHGNYPHNVIFGVQFSIFCIIFQLAAGA